MSDLVAKAITEVFGERCPDFEPECHCCKAWAEFDRMISIEAALDAKEIESGLTSNGSLWRFWSTKARDLAVKNATLEAELQKAREALEPFASLARRFENMDDDDTIMIGVAASDLRRATAIRALSQDKEARE